MNRVVVYCLLSTFLVGCAGSKSIYVSPRFHERVPQRVAMLPLENESVDLTGPEMLRKMVAEKLKAWGYAILSLEETDAKLREMGITDGGQLRALSPKEMAQHLNVDGLCFGSVEQFSFQNIGFYLKRAVKLRLKLVDPSSGENLWEGVGESKHSEIHGKEEGAGKAFVRGWSRKMVENIMKSPLRQEAQGAVDKLFTGIPRRPL
ncbi:MAG: DUF799 family lipoprotein [Elusimicrobia bacterium]|nr:DUF799 family lipoprotein [Elusimicrobiota bacterium]